MSLYSPFPTNLDELYDLISAEEIFYFYFGEFEQGAWYTSPFREESNPSFVIDYYKGQWMWRDFGISNKTNDAVQFVKTMYNISYQEALNKIYTDIILGEGIDSIQIKKKAPQIKEKKVHVKFWKPKFESTIDYWSQYDIRRTHLEFYNIYEGMVWYNENLIMRSTKYKCNNIYVFDKSKKIWKGYAPYAKNTVYDYKWFSHNISGHVQNWDNLGKFGNKDVLFITKSYKDCIVLNNSDYNAIAPHAESMFLAGWDIDYLKTQYKYIYVFYDNDQTGVTRCTEFTSQNNLNYINIPKDLKEGVKDPSDVVKEFNYKLLEDIILDKFDRDGV